MSPRHRGRAPENLLLLTRISRPHPDRLGHSQMCPLTMESSSAARRRLAEGHLTSTGRTLQKTLKARASPRTSVSWSTTNIGFYPAVGAPSPSRFWADVMGQSPTTADVPGSVVPRSPPTQRREGRVSADEIFCVDAGSGCYMRAY